MKFITYQNNPILRELTYKLQKMNHETFQGMLTIVEPGIDNLFWTDEYIFGVQCAAGQFLCDKIPARTLKLNEHEMIPELVRCITPWFKVVKAKCDEAALESKRNLPALGVKHKRLDKYLENGRYYFVEIGADCAQPECTCERLRSERDGTTRQVRLSRLSE